MGPMLMLRTPSIIILYGILSENYNTVDRDALYQNALSRGFRRRLATVSLGALVIK